MGVAVASTVDPWFVNTALQSNEARFALAALVGRSTTDLIDAEAGVLPGGTAAFTPVSNGTSTLPRVSVGRGFAVVQSAAGGTYICTWPVATNVSLTAPASNPRIDTLCARVRDNDVDSSGVKLFELITVDGAPGASPSAPAIPSGYLPLYDIRVGSTAQSGVLTITDRRRYTRAAGGIRYCPAWELSRAGSGPGDIRVLDNGQIDVWVGSVWASLASPAVWTQFTPVLTSSLGGNLAMGALGSAIARYIVIGKLCHLRYIFRISGAGYALGKGPISTTLPPGVLSAPSEETQILAKINARGLNSGLLFGIFNGLCFIPPSSSQATLWFPYSKTQCDLAPYQSTDNSGNVSTGVPLYPGDTPVPFPLVIQGTIEIT